MINNKKCLKCGLDNDLNSNFCANCGELLEGSRNLTNVNSQQYGVSNADNKTANLIGTLSLIIYFLGGIFIVGTSTIVPKLYQSSIESLGGFCPMIGIILMIYGRIRYPNNKVLKVSMWLIIVSMVLYVIAFILLTIWCFVVCSELPFDFG